MRRRILLNAMCLFILVFVSLSYCSLVEGTKLKLGTLHYPEHPFTMTCFFFAERVSQISKGRIEIEVHHSKSLGDARELVEYLRTGTVDIAGISVANLTHVVPSIDLFCLPYLFKNDVHYWAVLNSDLGWSILKPLEEKGIRLLFWMDAGARSFYTRTKPIMHPDDLKGMKIRVMASPIMIKTVNTMGGSGVPLAWGELYTALQTGVVDGAENNPPSVLTEKHYEVTKFFSLDEHFRIPDTVLISMITWKKLSPEDQKIISAASSEAQAYMRGAWKVFTDTALFKLKDLTKISYPKKEPFMAAVKDMVMEEAKRLGVEGIVSQILELSKKY